MSWFGKNNADDLNQSPKKLQEEIEEDEENNTYEYDYSCDNCGESYTLEIPVGTKVEDFISTDKCETCGCRIKV